ncbi:MAG: GNAT family N-acetyltransferase [Rubrivivax sp.]|nr:GNAT family N-acetyltransferase [Rubrivivax sp.]
MRWTWARFAELAVDDLYDALALRARVFVVEQACAFQDPDGVDRESWHLLGRDTQGVLTGYLRVVDGNDPPAVGASDLSVVPVVPRVPGVPGMPGQPAVPGGQATWSAPAIGRVVTAPEVRGTGAGRTLFAEGLARCLAVWPGRGIRLNAQAHLERFYGGFGFVRAGENFLEDDIPHVPMWRAP